MFYVAYTYLKKVMLHQLKTKKANEFEWMGWGKG